MKEYGGYLPLELPQGKEYYDNLSGMRILRLNCGRSAIYCALLSAAPKKVYIPYYNCATVTKPFELLKIPYEYYRLDDDFIPAGVSLAQDEYLLWVNYFGTAAGSNAWKVFDMHRRVIFDNTQAFFSPPVRGAYNVYSCRKFFGVSDGAYLIADRLDCPALTEDMSATSAHYMIKAYESGTNGSYADHLANEAAIFSEPKLMSAFTRRVLSSIDYSYVKKRRIENYKALADILGPMNRLSSIEEDQIPMVYPLLMESEGLREYLVKNRVYAPHWWKCVLEMVPVDSLESRLSRHLAPLPIDQRYDSGDMREIAEIVKRFASSTSV